MPQSASRKKDERKKKIRGGLAVTGVQPAVVPAVERTNEADRSGTRASLPPPQAENTSASGKSIPASAFGNSMSSGTPGYGVSATSTTSPAIGGPGTTPMGMLASILANKPADLSAENEALPKASDKFTYIVNNQIFPRLNNISKLIPHAENIKTYMGKLGYVFDIIDSNLKAYDGALTNTADELKTEVKTRLDTISDKMRKVYNKDASTSTEQNDLLAKVIEFLKNKTDTDATFFFDQFKTTKIRSKFMAAFLLGLFVAIENQTLIGVFPDITDPDNWFTKWFSENTLLNPDIVSGNIPLLEPDTVSGTLNLSITFNLLASTVKESVGSIVTKKLTIDLFNILILAVVGWKQKLLQMMKDANHSSVFMTLLEDQTVDIDANINKYKNPLEKFALYVVCSILFGGIDTIPTDNVDDNLECAFLKNMKTELDKLDVHKGMKKSNKVLYEAVFLAATNIVEKEIPPLATDAADEIGLDNAINAIANAAGLTIPPVEFSAEGSGGKSKRANTAAKPPAKSAAKGRQQQSAAKKPAKKKN